MIHGSNIRERFLRPFGPLIPLFITVLLVLFFFRAWYFQAGYLTFGDWRPELPMSAVQNFPVAKLWIERDQLGVPTPIFYPFYTLYSWLAHFQIGFPIAERIQAFWFFPPVLISGTWLFTYALTKDRLAASLASFVSFMTPTMLLPAFGGHTNATNAMAFAPWSLLGAYQMVRQRNLLWLSIVGISFFAESLYDVRWAPLTLVFMVVFALAASSNSIWRKLRDIGLCVVAALIGAIAENLYWLLPHIVGSATALAPPNGNLDPAWVVRLSVMTFGDALATWNPFFVNDFIHQPIISAHAPAYALLYPLIVVASAALGMRRSAPMAFAALATYFLGAFFLKGANDPFPGVYPWFFNHFPIFNAYRDPSKFAFVVVFSASTCIALGISAVHRARYRYVYAISVMLFAALLCIHAFDRIGGVVVARAMPARYAALNGFLEADTSFGRVLALPEDSRWLEHTTLHPVINGEEIGNGEFMRWQESRDNPAHALSYIYSPLFPRLLQYSAVRYIVFDDTVYDDATVNGLGDSSARVRDILNKTPYLREVARLGTVSVFKFVKPPIHAWTSTTAVLISGDYQSFAAAPLLPELQPLEPAVFSSDLSSTLRFEKQVSFDRAISPPTPDGLARPTKPVNASARYNEGVAVADAARFGTSFGISRISPQRIASPRSAPVDVTNISSTVPKELKVTTATVYDRRVPAGVLLSGPIPAAARFIDENGTTWNFRALRVVTHSERVSVFNIFPGAIDGELVLDSVWGSVRASLNGHQLKPNWDGHEISFRLHLETGRNTLKIEPTGPIAVITSARFIGEIGASASAEEGIRTFHFEPIPIYTNPLLRLNLHTMPSSRRYTVAVHAKDRAGRSFFLVMPNAGFLGDVDLRSRLWWAFLMPMHDEFHESLLRNDAYDYWYVDSVTVVDRGRDRSDRWLPASIQIKSTEPGSEPARTALSVPPSAFRSTSIIGRKYEGYYTRLTLDFSIPWKQVPWNGSVCKISTNAWKDDVLITRTDRLGLSGVDMSGSTIFVPWGDVATLSRSTDFAAIEVPTAHAQAAAILVVDAKLPQGLTYSVALHLRADRSEAWDVEAPASRGDGRYSADIDVRKAAFSRLGSLQKLAVDRVVLLVQRKGSGLHQQIRIASVSLAPAADGKQARLFIRQSAGPYAQVASALGSGSVPGVVRLGRGLGPAADIHPVALGAVGTSNKIHIASGKWFVFADRYDSGWQLQDSSGRVAGHHMMAFGLLNAWYSPRGLHGTYVLRYVPDTIAPLGFVLGLLVLLALTFVAFVGFVTRSMTV